VSSDPSFEEQQALKHTVSSLEELRLREQLQYSERELEELERELTAIEVELEAQIAKSEGFEALVRVCDSLEDLDRAGASHLFWGDIERPANNAEHLEGVRSRIDEFTDETARIEDRRDAILDKIGDKNRSMDYLYYDLRDATEREESRKAEWLVEREETDVAPRALVMPWSRGYEEDARSRRSVLVALLLCIAAGWLFNSVDLPIPERAKLIEVPERVAKLVREELPKPKPEPEPVIEEPEPEPEPEEPKLQEEPPPEPEDIPEAVEQPVVAESAPVDTKEQVKSKGILAFRESFAKRADLDTNAKLGSQARLSTAGENSVGRPERSMVTTSAPGSSGGINLSSISRDVGGGGGDGIEGVAVSRVASSIGGGEGPARPLSAGVAAGRTDEEIQIVFDRYKASLYRLYNRELRKNPTLRGQLVLRLTIEPDGSVSMCELQSSDMGAPALANQVVERVRTFDFGAKDVGAMTIIYPIDFLPAG
jgi:outer membrane biosynthesis protein TonB